MTMYTFDVAVMLVAHEKEKVVTIRMNPESFRTIEDYAKGKGLSVSAYITSVLDTYTEFFIPLASIERIAFPKKALYQFFSMLARRVWMTW